MKNTVRMIALAFFVGINARCENVGQCPEFDKFAQHYGLSSAGLMGQKIQDCQRNPDCFGRLKDRSYGSISALPGIYMKGSDVPRVINALRMQNCIERHNLYLLGLLRNV